ncbi:MAG TPA: hypothetical protein VMT71_03835 [Syntrophorhabdales bacterium]|nr:hypothetical protein [Syntrophorhabdales bacterium]
MQQSLTLDKSFVEERFADGERVVEEKLVLDRGFVTFLLVMILLFVLFGMIANPGSFVSPDYQTFW